MTCENIRGTIRDQPIKTYVSIRFGPNDAILLIILNGTQAGNQLLQLLEVRIYYLPIWIGKCFNETKWFCLKHLIIALVDFGPNFYQNMCPYKFLHFVIIRVYLFGSFVKIQCVINGLLRQPPIFPNYDSIKSLFIYDLRLYKRFIMPYWQHFDLRKESWFMRQIFLSQFKLVLKLFSEQGSIWRIDISQPFDNYFPCRFDLMKFKLLVSIGILIEEVNVGFVDMLKCAIELIRILVDYYEIYFFLGQQLFIFIHLYNRFADDYTTQLLNTKIILIPACQFHSLQINILSQFSKESKISLMSNQQKTYPKTLKHIKSLKKIDITSKYLLDEFDAPLPASCVDLRPFHQVDQESQCIICQDKSEEGEMKQVHYNELFDRQVHSLEKFMEACNFSHQELIEKEKLMNFEQDSPQSSSKYSSPLESHLNAQTPLKRQALVMNISQNLMNGFQPSKVRIINEEKRVSVIKSTIPEMASNFQNGKVRNLTNVQPETSQKLSLRKNIIVSDQIRKKSQNRDGKLNYLIRQPKKIKRTYFKMEEEQCIQSSLAQYNPQRNPQILQNKIGQHMKKSELFSIKPAKLQSRKYKNYKGSFMSKAQRQLLISRYKTIKIKEQYSSPDIKLQFKDANRSVRSYDKAFQLINQYSDLVFIMGLIEHLITIYDKGYLFRFSLDFQSGCQQDEDQIQTQNHEIKNKTGERLSKKLKQKKNSKIYTLSEKQKLALCETLQQKVQLQKEIKFQKSDLFIDNFKIARQLKPYLRKLPKQDKILFISIKQDLLEVKDLIQHYEKTHAKGDEHICRICGLEFQNGRQLGGHMSRKHPGKSFQYGMKRDNHKAKVVQRIRRQYFRSQKKFQTSKNQIQVKLEYQD